MIPFILVGVGAYMIADSLKKEEYARGGVTFEDKVQSVKKSLLERKKVAPSVQKDYGKTYSPKEAEESARRIVGSMKAKGKYYADGGDIKEIEVKKEGGVEIEITKEDEGRNAYYSVSYEKDGMEITGNLIPYNTGRDTEYEFSPNWFDDKATEDYYADHWEEVEDEILKVFYENAYKKGGKI